MATINSINSNIPIEISKGGTNATSFTSNGVSYYDGSKVASTAAGTSGYVLTSNGASAPTYQVAGSTIPINAQTGTTYTLAASDAGKLITLTNASAITLTVPKEATVSIPTGSIMLLYQGGAGTVTVSPEDANVYIRSADSLLSFYARYSVACLVKIDINVWSLSGDLA